MSAGLAYLLGLSTGCLCAALWRPVCRFLRALLTPETLWRIRNPRPAPVPARRQAATADHRRPG